MASDLLAHPRVLAHCHLRLLIVAGALAVVSCSGGDDPADASGPHLSDGGDYRQDGAPPADAPLVGGDASLSDGAATLSDGGGDSDAPPVDADCPQPVEVIIYGERAWNPLADALAADPSPCADYYISIPALSGDKTMPRGGDHITQMRARGPRFHALAEFHFTTWNQHVKDTGITWREAGIEFRRRMAAAGYDTALGDSWAINELPSSIRSDAGLRANIRQLLVGLHDGPDGAQASSGAVFTVGLGQKTVNFSVYKPRLEIWLEDAAFWQVAGGTARFWAQEVYVDPDFVCVPDTNTGLRSGYINDYAEHVARLANAGPASAAAARTYLNAHYVPLMNGAWRTAAGYGNTDISLTQMQHHISTQVYAARAWAGSHPVPDGRIGFGWSPRNPDADPGFAADVDTLAARLAAAIHGAYDDGGGAARFACSPSGAYTWCQCAVAGATFNDGWKTFATW